ncbi:MAG: hypothetical protein Q27BB25_15380 [Blastomonas sp. CACIA14H2]|uniref:hypothetical protein n=1 Tax=Blastomonas sp. CACIA14H2 TaxID=1419876 RepID=UPI0003D0600E|nr:MAG: hypothetical protein Q27BB25_15380 [Blastomonas sp. CACIA14H2]
MAHAVAQVGIGLETIERVDREARWLVVYGVQRLQAVAQYLQLLAEEICLAEFDAIGRPARQKQQGRADHALRLRKAVEATPQP